MKDENNFDNSKMDKYLHKMHRVKLLWVILAVFVLVIVAVGVIASIEYPEIITSEAESESIAESASIQAEEMSIAEQSAAAQETTPETTQDPFMNYVSPVDFEKLWEQNPDVIAWLSIPSLEIEYPVLQNPDEDEYYLRRNIDREHDTAGCLFTEKTYNKTDFTDPVTIVYGHNMHDGSMFGTFQEYFTDNIGEDEKVIIYLPDRERSYTIFSAMQIGPGHLLYGKDMRDYETFAHFAVNLLNPRTFGSTVADNAMIRVGERLLILSTCVDGDNTKRYIVAAKETGPGAPLLDNSGTLEENLDIGLLLAKLIEEEFAVVETSVEETTEYERVEGNKVIKTYDKVETDNNGHVSEQEQFEWNQEPGYSELGTGDILSPKTGPLAIFDPTIYNSSQ